MLSKKKEDRPSVLVRLVLFIMAIFFLANAGRAQEAGADATADAADDFALDEIVVTAQKRAEDIQDVPLSVTAIGEETMKERNIGDLNTLSTYAPNLSVSASPTFNFIYMRGLGSGYNRGFEQSVATIIDEVFYGRSSYLSNGLLDLAAVEVLRGPQGTLYGKNSAAGALHLKTSDPTPDWAFDGDILGGENSHYRMRGAVSGPIIEDKLSFRLAALGERRDGGIENVTTGVDEANLDNNTVRGKLRWDISDDLWAQLAVTGFTVDQQGSGTQLVRGRDRHIAAMQVFDPTTEANATDGKSHQDFRGFVDRGGWDATGTVKWTFGEGYEIASLTNYATFEEDVSFDADFSPIPFITLQNDEVYDQLSQELRLTSPPGTVDFVAGLYFFQSTVEATYIVRNYLDLAEVVGVTGAIDMDFDNALLGTTVGTAILARQTLEGTPEVERSEKFLNQESSSYAAFGQATWHINDQWDATLGARVTYEDKSVDYTQNLLNLRTGGTGEASVTNPLGSVVFPAIQTGSVQFTENRSREETDVSPKFSVEYRPTYFDDWAEDFMAYGTIARGFKGGGYNAQALNPGQLEYEEENSITYEGGVKSTWWDGRFRANASLFWTDYKDLQISAFNGVAFVVTNAADAEIKGVEFETMLRPWAPLTLSLHGALTEAEYVSFVTGPCPAETAAASCDLSGKSLTDVPEVDLTFDAAWNSPLPFWDLGFHIGTTVHYVTESFQTVDQDPIDVQDAHTTVSARIGIGDQEGRWSLSIHGTNLTDEDVLTGSNDVPVFTGSHFGGPIPPRNFTAVFRTTW